MIREDIVILSTADWDNPFWTNKQHVAVELARRGHRILYVNSLGLRRPSVNKQDIRRILRRLRKAFLAPEEVRENIFVWSPFVLPFQKYALVRWFNRQMLNCLLGVWLRRFAMSPGILWTYNPLTLDLVDNERFAKLVYHCVDEIKAQPGMPVETLERSEEKLVRSADIVFVTAKALLKDRIGWNPKTFYYPNVADYGHFSKAMSDNLPVPQDLALLPGPRIGFVGAISGYKLDFELIRHVAVSHPEWSLIMIGKVGEGDPCTDVGALNDLQNLYLIGPRSYDILPNYLKGLDVALLPNRLNDYTRGMFPMKFFEYLAAGKPIVSTSLESLQEFSSVYKCADSQDGFVSAIEDALDGKVTPLEERLAVACKYTYGARMEKMMALVDEISTSKGGD